MTLPPLASSPRMHCSSVCSMLRVPRDFNDPGWYDHLSRTLERDQYHFDDVIFETVPTSPAECAIVMRPVLDQMANAGGTATSPIFDSQSQYILLTR